MSQNKPEVVCLGMAVSDILVKGVKAIEINGQTQFVENIDIKPGGDAVNEAITLANLGHNTRLFTLVGKDSQGYSLIEVCKSAGIDVQGVTFSEKNSTSTSIVLISDDGERSFLSKKDGTVDEYALDDINLDLIEEGVKVVSIASLFCSNRLNDDELSKILDKAKQCGAITIADLVLNRADCRLDDIEKTLSKLDYIVPSLDEAEHFTGKTNLEDIVSVFKSYGVKNVVIKLGKDGVYSQDNLENIKIPTFATKIVDTTGAGDNFMAGFISGILRGLTLKDCLEFGTATSAISISTIGATGAVKSLEQVNDFLNNIKKEN